MAKTIFCDITSAEKHFFADHISMIIAPTIVGDIGVYPGHAPLFSMLKSGPVRLIYTNDTEKVFHLSGGFIEIQPSSIYILADTVLHSEELNEVEILKAKRTAEEILKEKTSKEEYYVVAARLTDLTAKIKTIQLLKKYRH